MVGCPPRPPSSWVSAGACYSVEHLKRAELNSRSKSLKVCMRPLGICRTSPLTPPLPSQKRFPAVLKQPHLSDNRCCELLHSGCRCARVCRCDLPPACEVIYSHIDDPRQHTRGDERSRCVFMRMLLTLLLFLASK